MPNAVWFYMLSFVLAKITMLSLHIRYYI